MNPNSRDFTVGALAFRVDGATGMLRHLRFGGYEVLRGVYPAVRDEHWGTLPAEVSPMEIQGRPGELQLRLKARVSAVDLSWVVEIEADARGIVRYRWHACAHSPFKSNRTGLCVLHPAEAAGRPCRIEHADGRKIAGWFPLRIAPHQPFREIRAITHRFAPGAEATVRMEGDVFEMEDQRNWSDASFKTYSRPLDRPKPYDVARGQSIAQAITVTIAGAPPRRRATPAVPRLIPTGQRPPPLPRIGLGLAGPLAPMQRARVKAFRPAHLRVATAMTELEATAKWARTEVDALGCELELAVRGATANPPARERLPAGLTVLLYDPDGNATSDTVVQGWRAAGFEAVGTGTENHFTELNRQRPSAAGAHTLTTFGLNAQVHAFDDASVLETLTQHAALGQQAAELGAPRPVGVAPITLGPGLESADPRLATMFGAVWTLASIAQLARAGAARATYFRVDGPGGILRPEQPTPLERLFLALGGGTESLSLCLDTSGPGDDPPPLYALMLRCEAGQRLLIAHTGESPLEFEIPYSGEGGILGRDRRKIVAGRVQLEPCSVWQLEISA